MPNAMANRFSSTLISFLFYIYVINAENDLKFTQIISIANKLPISDCRRIVASLDLDSYEFPELATSAAMKLPSKASCLDLLAQWRYGIGKTQTHTILVRRLKQTGFLDLADWLSKSVFTRSLEDEGDDTPIVTETYETETFTFEAEAETEISWIENEVGSTILPNLDTDDADLFAEILAVIAGIVAILWLISKLMGKCKRRHPEDLPLRSANY